MILGIIKVCELDLRLAKHKNETRCGKPIMSACLQELADTDLGLWALVLKLMINFGLLAMMPCGLQLRPSTASPYLISSE